jgi:hypothetical protein
MLVAPLVGYWLDWSHGDYAPLFVIAGSIYLVAFALIHWLTAGQGPSQLNAEA